MKLVKEDRKQGLVTVIPHSSEDLYILYHIISPGDRLRARTTRKMKGHDSEKTDRIQVTMEIEVLEVEFKNFSDVMRVRGTILWASDDKISLGSHHTIKIALLRELSIGKENWTRFDLDRLAQAQLGDESNLLVVTLDDDHALVAQVGNYAFKILLELTPSIPRKGSDPNQYQQGLKEMFAELSDFLDQNQELASNKIIGGPGFTHGSFMDYLKQHNASLMENTRFVATKSAGRSGVKEIISEHTSDDFAKTNTIKQQSEIMDQILEHIGKNTNLIAYANDVYQAAEMGAVEHLLVLDTELHDTVEKREKIGVLMDTVKQYRGEVHLVNKTFDTGKILEGLGKMAAILRYAIK